MTEEEVKIKVGLDGSGIGTGAEMVKAKLNEMGDVVGHAMAKTKNPVKVLKHALDELKATSPMLGQALTVAMNPVAGAVLLVAAGVMKAISAYEEWEKKLDEIAEKASKPIGNPLEARREAMKEIADAKREAAKFEKEMAEGKPGEKADKAYREKIAAAKELAGGDEKAFLIAQKKIQLDELEILKLKEKIALEKYRHEVGEQESYGKQYHEKNLPKTIEGDVKGIEEEEKERAALQAKIDRLKSIKDDVSSTDHADLLANLPGIVGAAAGHVALNPVELFKVVSGEIEKLEAKSSALTDSINSRRGNIDKASKAINEGKSLKDRVSDAKAEASAIRESIARIERDGLSDGEKIRAEERKLKSESIKDEMDEQLALAKAKTESDEVTFLQKKMSIEGVALLRYQDNNDEREAAKLRNEIAKDSGNLELAIIKKVRDQKALDRDIKQLDEDKAEAIEGPYRPALEEIANSTKWNTGDLQRLNAQRRADASDMAQGNSFMQEHSQEAQRLMIAEDELQRASRIDGTRSERFKSALKERDSIRSGLENIGLLKKDHTLENIENHLSSLNEKASSGGLMVQPVMLK